MVLEFIPNWLAVTFLVLGIAGLVFRSRFAMMIAKINPLFNAKTTLVALGIIGILAGGLPLLTGFFGGIMGNVDVASITGTEQAGVVASSIMLSDCFYASGTGLTGNTTIRADPNSNKIVFLDVDGTEYITYSAIAGNNVNVTFTCVRTGDVEEAGDVQIVVKGDEFKAETSTTDSSTYNIVETSSSPSSIWAGKYKQTLYVGDGAYGKTTDSQEYGYLSFAAGERQLTLGVLGEVDATSLTKLNNYTQKSVGVYQRVDGSDSLLGTIVINKLP